MHFILIDDIEDDRHYIPGELFNHAEWLIFIQKVGMARGHCFSSLDLALEWNANEGELVPE